LARWWHLFATGQWRRWPRLSCPVPSRGRSLLITPPSDRQLLVDVLEAGE
jgi:hypothetical protein